MNATEFRMIRNACGLTLADTVAYLGVSPRTVPHYEEGRNGIPAERAEKMRDLARRVWMMKMDLIRARSRSRDPIQYFTSEEAYLASPLSHSGLPMRTYNAAAWTAYMALVAAGKDIGAVEVSAPTVERRHDPVDAARVGIL